jgi:hypothetical protein
VFPDAFREKHLFGHESDHVTLLWLVLEGNENGNTAFARVKEHVRHNKRNTSGHLRVYRGDQMTDSAPATVPAEAAPKGLVSRIFGVVFSPRATYTAVAARPQWFGVLAVCSLLVAGGYFVLLSTEVGKQAAFDQQTQMIESFGVKLNDQALAGMEAGIERARYTTPIGQLIGIPLVLAIFSGILLGIFNALLGGDATYKQVFAIMAHSGVITALQQLFAIPLDFVRETLSSPTSLSVFFPFVADASFLGRLLSSIDLFQIWSTLSLAIGLGVLYKRRTAPIAISFFTVYFVIVVAIAAVRAALS